jgi:peroxiredoxin Q/BCP
MSTQIKTLTYENSASGQQRKIADLQYHLNTGWEVVSETVSADSFNAGSAATSACCLGLLCTPICMPLGLVGNTKKGQIVVTLKKETVDQQPIDTPPSQTSQALAPVAPLALPSHPVSSDPSQPTLPLVKQLEVGDRLPFFVLTDQGGISRRTDQLEGKALVLFFYLQDSGAGCSMAVRSFQSQISEFEKLGAVVWGMANGDAQSHASFSTKHSITYPLLSDLNHNCAKELKVDLFMGIPAFAVYVFDSNGYLIFKNRNSFDVSKFAPSAIEALRPEDAT